MGSEMCIRDRGDGLALDRPKLLHQRLAGLVQHGDGGDRPPGHVCLLYTSDAADERSSVDLGGRRIIKKKNSVRL